MAQAPKAFVDICLDILKAKEDKEGYNNAHARLG